MPADVCLRQQLGGPVSHRAGVTGPDAKRLLGERGFSVGHFPQSFCYATIGGFAATRSSGQNSAGYGRFDDMVRGLRAVTRLAFWTSAVRRLRRPAPICGSCSSAPKGCSA